MICGIWPVTTLSEWFGVYSNNSDTIPLTSGIVHALNNDPIEPHNRNTVNILSYLLMTQTTTVGIVNKSPSVAIISMSPCTLTSIRAARHLRSQQPLARPKTLRVSSYYLWDELIYGPKLSPKVLSVYASSGGDEVRWTSRNRLRDSIREQIVWNLYFMEHLLKIAE